MTDCRCHQCKIAWLERHLPLGVALEPPILRCKGCGVAADVHRREPCPLPATRDDHGIPRCTQCHVMVSAHAWSECPLPETYWDARPWPVTFGAIVAGIVAHFAGGFQCLQCLECAHYAALDADWGTCQAPNGQYHGREVFEHWTCRAFTPAPEDTEDGDD